MALVLLTLGAACTAKKSPPEPSTPAAEPITQRPEAIDPDQPETCEACHATVYAEWTQSMHAQAHHFRDPIYAAVRTVRLKKEGPELAQACAGCHGPRATDAPDGPIAQQGVSCASCHAVATVKPDVRGAKALTWTADKALLGPHDPGPQGAQVHATGPAPAHMKDGSSLCLACHGELSGVNGVPVCTTGPEWAETEAGSTCVQCHMPTVEGPSGNLTTATQHRSHRFLGPRAAWGDAKLDFVAQGVTMSGRLDKRTLRVALVNTSQHALPSGFPGRVVVLSAVGFDAEGKEVWTSQPSLLTKVYHDAEGKPVLAPYAKTLAKDSRLKPGETRNIAFEVPLTVHRAELQLGLRLVPPPLAEKLGLAESPLAGMKPVLKASVTRAQ